MVEYILVEFLVELTSYVMLANKETGTHELVTHDWGKTYTIETRRIIGFGSPYSMWIPHGGM